MVLDYDTKIKEIEIDYNERKKCDTCRVDLNLLPRHMVVKSPSKTVLFCSSGHAYTPMGWGVASMVSFFSSIKSFVQKVCAIRNIYETSK